MPVAIYARVSTGWQAENETEIAPDVCGLDAGGKSNHRRPGMNEIAKTLSRRGLLMLVALLMLAVGHAEAKTDRGADPDSGTGGITITGVTNTTTYQYQAPALTVTSVNGVPVASALPLQSGEAGESYDVMMRRKAKLPPEWFTCKTADDCGLARVPCNASLAVSKAYKDDAEAAICQGPSCEDQPCDASRIDTSLAVCDKGQCVTVDGYKLYKPAGQK